MVIIQVSPGTGKRKERAEIKPNYNYRIIYVYAG